MKRILTLTFMILVLPLLAGAAADPDAAFVRWSRAQEGGGGADTYRAAQRAMDQRQWAEAAVLFDQIAAGGGQNADAALYWRAHCEHKQSQLSEALQTLRELEGRYPESRWLDDAEALELEIRKAAGQRREPEDVTDEELKLYALQSLMHVDDARAVDVLERFLQSSSSTRLKEQALFVLSQSDSRRASEILGQVAKGQQHPELRMKAVEYLGLADDAQARRVLEEIYNSTDDSRLKRQVLEAFMLSDDKARVFSAATGESDPLLRRKAIELLGVMDAVQELEQLYASEKDVTNRAKLLEAMMIADAKDQVLRLAREEPEPVLRRKAIEMLGVMDAVAELRELYERETDPALRHKLIESFFLADDSETLARIARTDADMSLRREAIEKLGLVGDRRAHEALTAIYAETDDVGVKRAVINGLFLSDAATELIEILRSETDRSLKREALEKLSLMDSDEALDYLIGVLDDE